MKAVSCIFRSYFKRKIQDKRSLNFESTTPVKVWVSEGFAVFNGEKIKAKVSLKGVKEIVEFECRFINSS